MNLTVLCGGKRGQEAKSYRSWFSGGNRLHNLEPSSDLSYPMTLSEQFRLSLVVTAKLLLHVVSEVAGSPNDGPGKSY
jgi:hypothetical protein